MAFENGRAWDIIPAQSGSLRGEAPILDESALSNLLGLLYDAASDQALWPRFLELLARATGGHAAAVVMHDSGPGHHMLMLNAGMSPQAPKLYREYYGQHDIWAIRGIPQIRNGEWFGASEELCSWAELRKTEFFNDFLLPSEDTARGMFAIISKEESRLTNLSVYRPARREPFGEKEVSVLKLLAPHLRRAFRLHFQLCWQQDRNRSFEMLLDSLSQGIILLGSTGVIHMNRAAQQLCASGDGLLVSTSGLAAESPVESAKLVSLIAQAVSTSRGDGFSAGGGLLISRKSGQPLNIVVSPVRNLGTDIRESVRAIVYVSDPSIRIRPRNELLEKIYGFTPAECRIALLIADGLSTSTIREMAGITLNTLRTHLASIYRKTNTSRQTQLVKLISLIGTLGAQTSSG